MGEGERDPTLHQEFLLPKLFWWEPLMCSCAPLSLLLSTLGDRLSFSPLSPLPPFLSPPSLLAACLLPSSSPPSPPAAAAVAALADPEMGRERARRCSSEFTALPARSSLRPRRLYSHLCVPRLQSSA